MTVYMHLTSFIPAHPGLKSPAAIPILSLSVDDYSFEIDSIIAKYV